MSKTEQYMRDMSSFLGPMSHCYECIIRKSVRDHLCQGAHCQIEENKLCEGLIIVSDNRFAHSLVALTGKGIEKRCDFLRNEITISDEMIIRSQKVHEIRDNLSQIGQKKSMAKSCTRPMEK